jgi:hypothetical protein
VGSTQRCSGEPEDVQRRDVATKGTTVTTSPSAGAASHALHSPARGGTAGSARTPDDHQGGAPVDGHRGREAQASIALGEHRAATLAMQFRAAATDWRSFEQAAMVVLSYGPPWAHYLSGYQDRLLGGPLGLPDLCRTVPDGVKHKDYGGEVLG